MLGELIRAKMRALVRVSLRHAVSILRVHGFMFLALGTLKDGISRLSAGFNPEPLSPSTFLLVIGPTTLPLTLLPKSPDPVDPNYQGRPTVG